MTIEQGALLALDRIIKRPIIEQVATVPEPEVLTPQPRQLSKINLKLQPPQPFEERRFQPQAEPPDEVIPVYEEPKEWPPPMAELPTSEELMQREWQARLARSPAEAREVERRRALEHPGDVERRSLTFLLQREKGLSREDYDSLGLLLNRRRHWYC